MSTRPWMPMYWGDYLADTAHFTATEHGAYLLLIAFYWTNGGLPNDEQAIRRIARLTSFQWSKISHAIRLKFSSEWKHKRIDDEIAKCIEKSRVNSANAKRRHSERTPIAPVSHPVSQTHSQPQPDSERKEEKKVPALRADADVRRETILSDWPADAFDQFWKKYPEKVGKGAAVKAFAAAKRSGVAWSRVLFALDRYIAEKPADRAWCHPTTWLNQGRWDDEPAANGGVNGKRTGTQGGAQRSGGADFFAGLAAVAADIDGNGPVARSAAEEIPVGRVNIDG